MPYSGGYIIRNEILLRWLRRGFFNRFIKQQVNSIRIHSVPIAFGTVKQLLRWSSKCFHTIWKQLSSPFIVNIDTHCFITLFDRSYWLLEPFQLFICRKSYILKFRQITNCYSRDDQLPVWCLLLPMQTL